MKAIIKNATLIASCLWANLNLAQFGITGGTGGAFGRTTAPIDGIGIGFFPNGVQTNARLHVNNFNFANPTGPLQNFLFRTDGGQGNMNMWQMYTGTAANTVTEKARLFIDPLACTPPVT